MGEKLFFHWETQVIVITIVFELIMISSIIYVWWGIDFKEKLMESIARVAVILVIVAAQVSLSAQVPLWVRYGEGGIQKRRGSIATSLGFRKFARAPAASRKGMPQAKSRISHLEGVFQIPYIPYRIKVIAHIEKQ